MSPTESSKVTIDMTSQLLSWYATLSSPQCSASSSLLASSIRYPSSEGTSTTHWPQNPSHQQLSMSPQLSRESPIFVVVPSSPTQ